MSGKEVSFNRIINGLSLTKHSLNDWLCITEKSPSHFETLIHKLGSSQHFEEVFFLHKVMVFACCLFPHIDPHLF